MQMQFVLWRLEAQQDWSRDALFATKNLAEAMDIKPKRCSRLFVALSGESRLLVPIAWAGYDPSPLESRH